MLAFMKAHTQDLLAVAPPEYGEILDQIRNDHELIDRLSITSEELEALSKCALLGTLTCKQDMLFILQQIRAAGGPASGGFIDQTILFPQPALPEDMEEDPIPPDRRHMLLRLAGAAAPGQSGSVQGLVRRRGSERFGILLWTIAIVVGLAGFSLVAMSRWRSSFLNSVAMPLGHAAPSAAWFSNLDRFNILLLVEALLVAGIAVSVYLRSRRGYRRFKIRPSRSWR